LCLAFVFRATSVHRIPQPNVRDDRETPLVQGHGTAMLMDLIWAKREAIYFCSEDWTGSISLIGFGKFADWRKGYRSELYFLASRICPKSLPRFNDVGLSANG
jgi:hypothetical protein